MTAGLEISGISKAFDGERALEDVALTVPAGSVLPDCGVTVADRETFEPTVAVAGAVSATDVPTA